ncbi:DUF4363 family protein [Eubacteriales bacterium OttesenSCG-928-M02]|nr:DUF4363 family protein [Eubacteriales bacterium OttesenSCG-928-M02]
MKKLLFSLGALALFILGSLWWEGHVDNHINEMENICSKALAAMEHGDDSAVEGEMEDFEKRWQHLKRHWKLMVSHQTLDGVEEQYKRAKVYWYLAEYNESYSELKALKDSLGAIKEHYEVSFVNIL